MRWSLAGRRHQGAKVGRLNLHRQTGDSEMNGRKQVDGVDIAIRVFQLHWIDAETGEAMSVQFKREKFLEHFANRARCLIGVEGCGGAQDWERKLLEPGHEVKLLPA